MIRKTIVIVLSIYVQLCFAQPAGLLNARLDSVINAKMAYKTKYISLKGNAVVVDSLDIKKVQADKKDSSIIVTFSDKTQKRIYANEFWGIITDYGQRRRFYKGIMFPVWSSRAPYFYRITKGASDRYYFSETLTGDIYSLTLTSVNEHVTDSVTKKNLETYIRKNFPENVIDNGKVDGSAFFDILTGIIVTPVVLLNLLAEFVK